MKYSSYDEAYQVLKSKGISDTAAEEALMNAGYVKPTTKTPDNDKSTVESEGWEELTGGDDDGDEEVLGGGTNFGLGGSQIATAFWKKLASPATETIKGEMGQTITKNTTTYKKILNQVNRFINRNKATTDGIVKHYAKKFGANAGKFVARNLGTILTSLIAAGQVTADNINGTIKKDYIYEPTRENYRKDFKRNVYAYIDKLLYDTLPQDPDVYNTKSEAKEQLEQGKRNKEAKSTYKDLKKYYNELDDIKEEYGADAANEAEKQISEISAENGVNGEEQEELKNDIRKKYDFKKFEDKDGNIFYKRVDKNGNTLQSNITK